MGHGCTALQNLRNKHELHRLEEAIHPTPPNLAVVAEWNVHPTLNY